MKDHNNHNLRFNDMPTPRGPHGHRGGRPGFGGGPRGGHFGPMAPGFPGFAGFGPGGRGPRAPRGGIRLGLLSLVEEQPSNGYALMQAFGEKTSGNWQPKSGSIYPVLNQLLDENLVAVDESGIYSLTDSGKALLNENRAEAQLMFQRLSQAETKSELFGSTFKLLDALRQTGGLTEADQADVVAKLDELRRDIYRKLAEQ